MRSSATSGAKEEPAELVAMADPEQGITLQTAASNTTAAAEELNFDASPIDPLVGWSYSSAAKRRPLGLICGPSASTIEWEILAEALASSTAPNPVFFALVDATPFDCSSCGGCGCGMSAVTAFSLRPVPYTRLPDEEYVRLLQQPEPWPPAQAGGLGCGAVRSGFIVDSISFGCEQVRGEEFLYTSKAPHVGLALCLQLALLPDGYTRMYGRVTKVGPLPEPDAPTDPVLGVSYFKSTDAQQKYTRDELLAELGTLHGQRVEGIVFLVPEQVGSAPAVLAGQWHVVLAADDRKQALWQLMEMTPLPRQDWIAFIPRN